jgi:hypothetical protein
MADLTEGVGRSRRRWCVVVGEREQSTSKKCTSTHGATEFTVTRLGTEQAIGLRSSARGIDK